jgi:cytochrome c oxidase accessory protein FixG
VSTEERRSSLQKDGRRLKIYQADVSGRFTNVRRTFFVLLLGVLLTLPFTSIRGRPGIWLDVGERRFYLLGTTFNAQDTYLMFFVLTLAAFAVVALTTVLGRVLCGWLCPHTVILEGLFRPIERLFQGPRNLHMKRDAGGWTFERLWRTAATQLLYLLIAAGLAHILVAYFISIPRLLRMMSLGPSFHPEPFIWVSAVTALLYFNFAWFREQTCLVVCPYGRMQSVLFDRDSLVIGYDEKRGEPRERGGRKGDCVDCNRCVVVCPTGIDIRNGLQVDCVACAACVDACDDVMRKIGKPTGLVRYDSQRGLAGEPRRMLRPRIIVYAALLLLLGVGLLTALQRRATFEANLLRLPGAPYELDGDSVRNAFQVHLINKNDRPERYRLAVIDSEGLQSVLPMHEVTLEASSSQTIPLFVFGHLGSTGEVSVSIAREGGKDVRILHVPFVAPKRPGS